MRPSERCNHILGLSREGYEPAVCEGLLGITTHRSDRRRNFHAHNADRSQQLISHFLHPVIESVYDSANDGIARTSVHNKTSKPLLTPVQQTPTIVSLNFLSRRESDA